jgi:hypothetical protein
MKKSECELNITPENLPYYATKVPYMFDMVFSKPMPDAALQRIVMLF